MLFTLSISKRNQSHKTNNDMSNRKRNKGIVINCHIEYIKNTNPIVWLPVKSHSLTLIKLRTKIINLNFCVKDRMYRAWCVRGLNFQPSKFVYRKSQDEKLTIASRRGYAGVWKLLCINCSHTMSAARSPASIRAYCSPLAYKEIKK